MSALTVAQNIARSVGLPVPSTLVSNTNQDARRLLQSINDAGRFLHTKDWNYKTVELTLSASGSETIGLPSGFRSLVPMSMWKVGTSEPVRGPIRPIEWQSIKYGTSASGVWDKVHIRWSGATQALYFNPVPATADQYVVLYSRTGWVNSGSIVTQVSADADTFLVDEYVLETEARWRFLKAIGQSYGEEKDEAVQVRNVALAEDGGMEVLDASHRGADFAWNYPDRNFEQAP